MTKDLKILDDIVRAKPSTTIRPREFFIAWSGVPTLAYDGFSSTLLAVKHDIEAAVPGIKKENPGSLWPKTTLGALRDDKRLTWHEALELREICDQMNQAVQSANVTFQVTELSVVVFSCRSLERRLCSTRIPLSGGKQGADDDVPANHLDQVEGTMRQFSRSELRRYWPDLLRDGNRESHYRVDHIEATLVYDLENQPDYLAQFIQTVNVALPGAYCWFHEKSRHLTVRALAM